jgi:hypothetical protein
VFPGRRVQAALAFDGKWAVNFYSVNGFVADGQRVVAVVKGVGKDFLLHAIEGFVGDMEAELRALEFGLAAFADEPSVDTDGSDSDDMGLFIEPFPLEVNDPHSRIGVVATGAEVDVGVGVDDGLGEPVGGPMASVVRGTELCFEDFQERFGSFGGEGAWAMGFISLCFESAGGHDWAPFSTRLTVQPP